MKKKIFDGTTLPQKKQNNFWYMVTTFMLCLIFGGLTFYYMSTTFWNKEITITDNTISMNVTLNQDVFSSVEENIKKCENVCIRIFKLDHDPNSVICAGSFCYRDCYKYCGEEFLND